MSDPEFSLKPRHDETPEPPPEPIPLPRLQTPARLAAFAAVLPVLVGGWVMLWRDAAQRANDPAVLWPDTTEKLWAVAGMSAVALLACAASGWIFGLVTRRMLTATREASLRQRHRVRMVTVLGFAGYTLNALVYYHALWQDFALIAPIVFQPYIPTVSLLPGSALGMGLGWLAATYGPPPFALPETSPEAPPEPPPSPSTREEP